MRKNLGITLVLVALIGGLFAYSQYFSQMDTFLPADVSESADFSTSPNKEHFEELHPLTIPAIQQAELAVSELRIVENLGTRTSYQEYIAEYTIDGLTLRGLLTVPVTNDPSQTFPAIVFVHGYIPPSQYRTQERYVAYVEGLAEAGFVVFKIDLRGHDQSEGEPSGAYFSPNYVYDTMAAGRALAGYSRVDAERIGLWGHSMAGNVVTRALVADSVFKSASIWAGAVFSYTDFTKYGLNDSSYDRSDPRVQQRRRSSQGIFDTYGEIADTSEFWQQVAPTSYLEGFRKPIQLHHALNDTVVNVGYSEDFAQTLEENNVPHELHIYQSGGHDIEGTAFSTAMQRTVQFFNSTL